MRRKSAPPNIGPEDVPAYFPTMRRPRAVRDAKSAARKLILSELDDLGDQLLRLRELKAVAHARARFAEHRLKKEKAIRENSKEKLEALDSKYIDAVDQVEQLKVQLEPAPTNNFPSHNLSIMTNLHLIWHRLEETAAQALATEKMELVPTFGMVGKGMGGGRGRMWPWWFRTMIFEQLVNGTKPSAVAKNIISDASYLTPWVDVVVPTQRFVRSLRYELRVLCKALSAYRVANGLRMMTVGVDGSEKKQKSLLTSNVQIETEYGPQTVILEAAYLTRG